MTANDERPATAMVLAAGMGLRMRPLTDRVPKPLINLDGRALLDHVLDRLAAAGVSHVVVNVHYLASQIESHVAGRASPNIVISDERDALLDTGGGVTRALPLLGDKPFFIHNSDSVWIERGAPALERMVAAWDGAKMDSLMLLAPAMRSLGYDGLGDFDLGDDGRLVRPATGARAAYVFAGASIAHPRLFDAAPEGRFSLNALWDRAIASGRMYGVTFDGLWMHVGSPGALAAAEAEIQTERSRA